MLPHNMSFSLEELTKENFDISRVGNPTLESTLQDVIFVDDSERVSYCADPTLNDKLRNEGKTVPAFVAAGPRKRLFFDKRWAKAAIVTCGGICPGLNDVIKAIVNTLYYTYGVKKPSV